MITIKGCQRCGGAVVLEKTEAGDQVRCIMCSRIVYIAEQTQNGQNWEFQLSSSARA